MLVKSTIETLADTSQFTAVLDHLLQGAYNMAKSPGSDSTDWLQIQELALKDDEESDAKIQVKVLEAQRQSVKLPFIRKVSKDGVIIPVNGEKVNLKRGQIIICDIVSSDSIPFHRGRTPNTVLCHEESGAD